VLKLRRVRGSSPPLAGGRPRRRLATSRRHAHAIKKDESSWTPHTDRRWRCTAADLDGADRAVGSAMQDGGPTPSIGGEVRFGCGADLLHVLRAVNSWRKSHALSCGCRPAQVVASGRTARRPAARAVRAGKPNPAPPLWRRRLSGLLVGFVKLAIALEAAALLGSALRARCRADGTSSDEGEPVTARRPVLKALADFLMGSGGPWRATCLSRHALAAGLRASSGAQRQLGLPSTVYGLTYTTLMLHYTTCKRP
jgi:hypothetical protein